MSGQGTQATLSIVLERLDPTKHETTGESVDPRVSVAIAAIPALSPGLILIALATSGPITIATFLAVATTTVQTTSPAFSIARSRSAFARGPRLRSAVPPFRPPHLFPPAFSIARPRTAVFPLDPTAVFAVARTRAPGPRRRSAALAVAAAPAVLGFIPRPFAIARPRTAVLRLDPPAAVTLSTLGLTAVSFGPPTLMAPVRQTVVRLSPLMPRLAAMPPLASFAMVTITVRLVVPRLGVLPMAMVALMPLMMPMVPPLGMMAFTMVGVMPLMMSMVPRLGVTTFTMVGVMPLMMSMVPRFGMMAFTTMGVMAVMMPMVPPLGVLPMAVVALMPLMMPMVPRFGTMAFATMSVMPAVAFFPLTAMSRGMLDMRPPSSTVLATTLRRVAVTMFPRVPRKVLVPVTALSSFRSASFAVSTVLAA